MQMFNANKLTHHIGYGLAFIFIDNLIQKVLTALASTASVERLFGYSLRPAMSRTQGKLDFAQTIQKM